MLQIQKKARVSPSHRARVIRARSESVLAFDVLRLLQPEVHLGVLQSVLKSYGSESASVGAHMVDTLCDTARPPIAMARVSSSIWEVPPGTASVTQDIPKMLLPSDPSVASAMFDRAVFARRWKRRYISLGEQVSEPLVNALSTAELSVQSWMRAPASGERPFPISRADRLRQCASLGRDKCKRRVVMIVRGAAQVACRLSGLDNAELVWLLLACHFADNSRTPHGKCESAKTTVRRLARGSPICEASADSWPGQQALNRPRVAPSAAEPHAEPSDVPQDDVASLGAKLVPSSRVPESA